MTLPKFNQEFKNLMRPLSSEEFQSLKENILKDGEVTDSLVVWKETGELIDGYHRAEIISGNPTLKWKKTELSFVDADEVKTWIRAHQLGRRNLSPAATQVARVEILAKSNTTAKTVAESLNVSPKTMQRAGEYSRMLNIIPEDLRKEIIDGKRVAGAHALKQLNELDENMRNIVYDKMRKDKSKMLHQCLPVLKKPRANASREVLESIESSFSGDVRQKFAVGSIDIPEKKTVEKFNRLSEIQKQTVDDVLATGGAKSLTEAMRTVESAPKKRVEYAPDIMKLNEKIEDGFMKLIKMIDELAAAHKLTGSSDHVTTIDTVKIARSKWNSWK